MRLRGAVPEGVAAVPEPPIVRHEQRAMRRPSHLLLLTALALTAAGCSMLVPEVEYRDAGRLPDDAGSRRAGERDASSPPACMPAVFGVSRFGESCFQRR